MIQQSKNDDFQLFRFIFFNQRKLLVGFLIAGLAGGVIYYKMAPQTFNITATILIKDEQAGNEFRNVFRQQNTNRKQNTIEDQIGLLKSFKLNQLTLENFGWHYKWSKKSGFRFTDMFPSEPFGLILKQGSLQQSGVPLRIRIESEQSYRIICDEQIPIQGTQHQIIIDRELNFGEPFIHPDFHFTLVYPEGVKYESGEEFILEFFDPAKLANDYKEKIEAERFNPLAESSLIRLKLNSTGLARDVQYINGLMATFLDFGVKEKNRGAENTIKFIDEQISGVNQSMESAGESFSEFRASNKTIDLSREAGTIVEKKNQLETEINRINSKLDYCINLRDYLENKDFNKDFIAPVITGFTDELLKKQVERLNELFTRRKVISLNAKENSPVILGIDDEIRFAGKILLENVKTQILQAEREKKDLLQQAKETSIALSRLPKTEKNLLGIKRNFQLTSDLYTFLLQCRAEAQIARASGSSVAQVLDPASEDTAIITGPVLLFDLFMGGLASLMAAFLVTVVQFFAINNIRDTGEVISTLGVATLGEIPQTSKRIKINELIVRPRSAMAESFRSLKMNIMRLVTDLKGKVIAVHALTPATGKSFITCHLAVALSLSRKKILLIDGDLQKPTLHLMMGQRLNPGLNEYLSGETDEKKIIRKTKNAYIDFIPAGINRPDAAEALQKQPIESLINSVGNEYDLILIDNSPYGIVNDPKIFGSIADLNIFLLRLNHSKKSEISRINNLGRSGVFRGLAVVLNGKPIEDNYYNYTPRKKNISIIIENLKSTLSGIYPPKLKLSKSSGIYRET
ncbi:MAG: GumC family protein [Cyclobacteriaceae bacterium]